MKNIISSKQLFGTRSVFLKYLKQPLLLSIWAIVAVSTFILIDLKFAALILIIVFVNIGGFLSGIILRQRQYWKSKQTYYFWDGLISNLIDIGILLTTYFFFTNSKEFIFLAAILLFVNQLTRVSRGANKIDDPEMFLEELVILVGTVIALLLGLLTLFFLR